MVLIDMPVALGKRDIAGLGGRVFQHRSKADTLDGLRFCDSGEVEDGRGEINRGNHGAGATRGDAGTGNQQRGLDAAVVEVCFATGEGPAVVRTVNDKGVVGDALALEFGVEYAEVVVGAADLVGVVGEFFAGFRPVGEHRRDGDFRGIVGGGLVVDLPAVMGVVGGEPAEERLVLRPVAQVAEPFFAAGRTAVGGNVEAEVLRLGHVVFAGEHGVVAGLAEALDEGFLTGGERGVEFGGAVVVRVAAGDDGTTARRAGRDGEIRLIKDQTAFGHEVEVRGLHNRVAVGPKIIGRDIIRDHKNEIRRGRGRRSLGESRCEQARGDGGDGGDEVDFLHEVGFADERYALRGMRSGSSMCHETDAPRNSPWSPDWQRFAAAPLKIRF